MRDPDWSNNALFAFYWMLLGDLNALKVAVAAQGPISVGIDAAHKSLRNVNETLCIFL